MKKVKKDYLDVKLPVDKRVKRLLKQMTMKEKIGQLVSTIPIEQVRQSDYSDKQSIVNTKKLIDKGIGQIGVAVRHSSPQGAPKIANEIQKYAVENTRLGIPVLIQDECVHGCKGAGSTVFPMSIGLAATWAPSVMEKIVPPIAKETKARGIRQAFSPTLNIARDTRCGRVEETYGEDPLLVSKMGVAFIKTLQKYGIAATPKHFVANFVGDGGRDSHPVYFSERILREIYFPAFKAAVKEAGCMSMMIAHTAIDGIPCSVNKWLMDTILRDEWGFEGFIVPDNTDVQKNHEVHFLSDSFEDSSRRCINAGLDTELAWLSIDCRLSYMDSLEKLVKQRKVPMSVIDKSVARILRIKFLLGLFENPYTDLNVSGRLAQSDAHRKLARESACETIVLLKNNKKALPLSKKIKSIALIGPNADVTRLGGYTCDDANEVTPVEGIKNKLGKNVKVMYERGCRLLGDDTSGFAKAVKIAKKADVVILCLGNSSDKVIGQPDITEGERHDRSNLDLPGLQETLIDKITEVNKNTIVVLQNGSAITMQSWIDKVDGIVEAWYPGTEGGNAIADVLFGDYNPGGKLPITFPVTTGQLPLYYNPRPHGRVNHYCDLRGKQEQFEFGFGLSYTKFEYSKLTIIKDKKSRQLKVKVSFSLKNIGKRSGDEVVQLYIRDIYSSITRPIKELKRFKRINLNAGEETKIEFILKKADFAYLDQNMKSILEPGDFNIMIGSSSDDTRLEKIIKI